MPPGDERKNKVLSLKISSILTKSIQCNPRIVAGSEPVGLSEGSARRRPISGNKGDYARNLKSSSYAQFKED